LGLGTTQSLEQIRITINAGISDPPEIFVNNLGTSQILPPCKDSLLAKQICAPCAAPVNSDLPPIFCFARQKVCRQTERGPAAKIQILLLKKCRDKFLPEKHPDRRRQRDVRAVGNFG
jgi:hypothetical protein